MFALNLCYCMCGLERRGKKEEGVEGGNAKEGEVSSEGREGE